MSENRAIPEISVDAKLLYEHLKTFEAGETVEWPELSSVIDRNVQNGGYGALRTALNRLERDDNVVFANVRGVGYKRLGNEEIIMTGVGFLDRIRRLSRRGARRTTCANIESLPREIKTQALAQQSILGAISMAVKPSRLRMIESKIDSDKPLSIGRTLDAFKE
jgi:hypothetical protein